MTRNGWLLIAVVIVFLLFGGATVVALREMGKTEALRRSTLLPQVKEALDKLIVDLAERGIAVFIGSTRRDDEKQAEIIRNGNSATSTSWHLLDRAVDLYPIDPETGQPDLLGKRLPLFRTMHERAVLYGFRGIAFNADGSKKFITAKKIWDGAHLEFPEGMTWAQAASKSGYGKRIA